MHCQVRERGALQRQRRRHHLARPDRSPLRDRCAGPLSLVPSPCHSPRRSGLRDHPLRRRSGGQALAAVPLRVPSLLLPRRRVLQCSSRRHPHRRPRRREPIRRATIPTRSTSAAGRRYLKPATVVRGSI